MIQRYKLVQWPGGHIKFVKDPNGPFCAYEDYAELKVLYDDAVTRFVEARFEHRNKKAQSTSKAVT